MYSKHCVRVDNQNLLCLRRLVLNRILLLEEDMSQIEYQLRKHNHKDKHHYELVDLNFP